MNIVLVYNPRSGSTPTLSELRDICSKYQITIDTAIAVRDGYEKTVLSHAAKDRIVAVVGGDGTISSVTKILIGTDAILAPIPGGTLNHFTKDLGVSQTIDEAFAELTHQTPRSVDIASVNNVTFLNNSSIGLYPLSLQTREALQDHRVAKWYAAAIASIRAFVTYRIYTVTINGETFKTPFLFVGNNDYHLAEQPSGRTSLTGGILSVYTIAAASRWQLVKIFAKALIGQLQTAEELKIWHTTELVIHTRRPRIYISRDGELERAVTPLTYKTLPRALRILGGNN